jgi:hypothetical protein
LIDCRGLLHQSLSVLLYHVLQTSPSLYIGIRKTLTVHDTVTSCHLQIQNVTATGIQSVCIRILTTCKATPVRRDTNKALEGLPASIWQTRVLGFELTYTRIPWVSKISQRIPHPSLSWPAGSGHMTMTPSSGNGDISIQVSRFPANLQLTTADVP